MKTGADSQTKSGWKSPAFQDNSCYTRTESSGRSSQGDLARKQVGHELQFLMARTPLPKSAGGKRYLTSEREEGPHCSEEEESTGLQ